jgi:cytochrome c553
LRASLLATVLLTSTAPADEFPEWAFPACSHPSSTPARNQELSVPGSLRHFTAADLKDWSVTKDWFPGEHPVPPPIIAASHAKDKPACGYCHLPDGTGRPENAKLAGLPAPYIVAQVKAFRIKERHAQQEWTPTVLMTQGTADLGDEDIAAAAEYFSRQPVKSFVRVVETAQVPNHHVSCYMNVPTPGRAVPLGQTIVEMPVDTESFERRDPHAAYVAYVPKGSIERGRALSRGSADGQRAPCATCHGADFKSSTTLPGPPLAGRFPGYLFRQLYAFQTGARAGDSAQLMQSMVAGLSQADLIALAAYTASLKP